MAVLETCDTWEQFLTHVKTKCSTTAFGNWLSPIKVLEVSSEEIMLEIPNIFVKEYLLSNFNKELCAFLPVNSSGEPAIHFKLATPMKKTPMITVLNSDEKKSENPACKVKLNPNYC